ncbi:MAG: hypothetical protein N2313_04520 [Meiothermus ruber]|nr:hypothetical protein [Meiothermus ruber]
MESRWAVIRDALYNPDDWDDQEWLSEVSELTRVYDLLKAVRPNTAEERARLERLLGEIRRAAKEFGFTPPPSI